MALHILHTALYALLGTAFIFSIIELGLSAYLVSRFRSVKSDLDHYNDYFDDYYDNYYVSMPAVFPFILFASIWTFLITPGAVASSWFLARRGPVSRKINMLLGFVLVVVYFVTMVFWLAGFADVSYLMGNRFGSAYSDAIIAFGVLLW